MVLQQLDGTQIKDKEFFSKWQRIQKDLKSLLGTRNFEFKQENSLTDIFDLALAIKT